MIMDNWGGKFLLNMMFNIPTYKDVIYIYI